MSRVSTSKDQGNASWQLPPGLPANRDDDDFQEAIVKVLERGGCDRNGELLGTGAIIKLTEWIRKSKSSKEYRQRELLMLSRRSFISSEDDHTLDLERGELRQKFLDALDHLPEQYRSILHAESQALPPIYERIASLLGIPIGTVRSRLSRAKAKLRTKLVALRIYDDLKESI
jgi:RNA polymerase sigma factor (sigma-70 family)